MKEETEQPTTEIYILYTKQVGLSNMLGSRQTRYKSARPSLEAIELWELGLGRPIGGGSLIKYLKVAT